MLTFLLHLQAGNGDTLGVTHPIIAGRISGLLELVLHLCCGEFLQKALGLLCGHSCLLCSLGRQGRAIPQMVTSVFLGVTLVSSGDVSVQSRFRNYTLTYKPLSLIV